MVAVQSVILLMWLGLDVVPEMVSALGEQAVVPEVVPIFWVSALHRMVDWWPTWGGVLIGGAIVLLPVRGKVGLGLAIVGGLAVVPISGALPAHSGHCHGRNRGRAGR